MKTIFFIVLNCFFVGLGCTNLPTKPDEQDLAGSYHRIKRGDTLAALSRTYRLSPKEIMEINGIDDERSLKIGQALFMPDPDPIGKKISHLKPVAKIESPPASPLRIFAMPIKGGTIIHNFSKSKDNPYDGIGIKAPLGTKILAAHDGRVLFVGNDGTKFGLIVIIEHQAPYITVYAHLNGAHVKAGQTIKRGEFLGTVGKSGGITVPHLHFQIRVDERPKDPKLYLMNY